ncbi:hypothetical protein DWW13_18350 [Blautia sp. AF14-40]|nr:hypothetical protein DWW13_18350 [Blautia sp. AF14-40]
MHSLLIIMGYFLGQHNPSNYFALTIHSLVELKNQLIQQGRYTDCVDELIFKVINAPTKRMKIEYV